MTTRRGYDLDLTFLALVIFGLGCSGTENCALTATCPPAEVQSPNLPLSDAGRAGGAPGLEVDAAGVMTPPKDGGAPSTVRFTLGGCGDAQFDLGEACDDGNHLSGDGCYGCEVEVGWVCANSDDSRSICVPESETTEIALDDAGAPLTASRCEPGTKRCTANHEEQSCTALGEWDLPVECPGQACPESDAGCIGACEPGSKQRTSAGLEEICSAEGAWGPASGCTNQGDGSASETISCVRGCAGGACCIQPNEVVGGGCSACGGVAQPCCKLVTPACSGGLACESGTCRVPKKAQGASCDLSSECETGSCVDGVCCNSSCVAGCMACTKALTGKADGACAAVSLGTDDGSCRKESAVCGQDGACNGAGGCLSDETCLNWTSTGGSPILGGFAFDDITRAEKERCIEQPVACVEQ